MSVAAAGAPFTNPKNGPKSRLAEKPVMYNPARLVPKPLSSTGKPVYTDDAAQQAGQIRDSFARSAR